MAEFNKDFLLGDLVPRAFINKVTLETKNKPASKTDNPHIVEPGDNVSAITLLASPPTESTVSTIQLVVKEIVNKDTMSTFWFGQNDIFQNLIKIKIIQSTNKVLTDRLNRSPSLLNQNPSIPLGQKLAGKFTPGLDFVEENIDLTSYHNIDSDNTTNELEKFFKTIDGDGNTVYDIPFTKEFLIDRVKIDHLTYFVFSYLDINSISQDIGIDVNSLLAEFEVSGIITSDIVFDDSRLLSTSRIFLDPDDQTWVGPVRLMDDGSYETDTENPVPLQLRLVPNTKVQDFRIIKRGQKQIIDVSSLEEDFVSKKAEIKQSISQQLDVIRNKPYMSEAFTSRDKSGNARFLFSIDYFNLIRDNAVFGKLIDANNQNIFDFTRIANLKVLRKRITRENGIDKLGSPKRVGNDFDPNTPVQNVIESGEKRFGQFSTRQEESGNLQEIMLGGTDNKVRTFSVMDKDISSITDGFYIYGVELEIEDNTSKFLEEMLNDLTDSNEILKEYYTIANIPGKEFYNKENDMFGQAFFEYVNTQYATPPNIPAIVAYENFLKLSTPGNKNSELTDEQKKILKTLVNISGPTTGNRQGILLLLEVMENAIGSIESLLDIYNNAKPKTNLNTPSTGKDKVDSKITTPVIKVVNFFNNISFDSDIEKDVGYEYILFDNSRTNQVGLQTINFQDYSSRTDQEILKYFKSTQGVNEKTKYSYFSPQRVLLNEPFSNFVLTSTKTNDDYSLLESMILGYNSSQAPQNSFQVAGSISTELSDEAVKYRNNMKGFFAKLGITITAVADADPEPTFQRTLGQQTYNVSSLGGQALNASPIDPVSKYSGELKIDGLSIDNQNPNVLFRSLSKIFVENGKASAASTDDPFLEDKQVGTHRVATDKTIEVNTITIFDENNSDGIIELMENYPLYLKSISLNNGFFVSVGAQEIEGAPKGATRAASTIGNILNQEDPSVLDEVVSEGDLISQKTVQQVRETFPIQVESIFQARNNSNLVKDIAFFSDDVLRDAVKLAKFNFNYSMLKKIEILEGFQIINGEAQITNPKWELLTIERLRDRANNKYALCRMVDYNNKPIGIYPKKGIMLPTINEHFMIAPVSGPPVVFPSKGLTRARRLIQQARSGVSDAERASQEAPVSADRLEREAVAEQVRQADLSVPAQSATQSPLQQSFTENYLSQVQSEGVDNAVKMISTSNAPSKAVPQNAASDDLSSNPQTVSIIRNFST